MHWKHFILAVLLGTLVAFSEGADDSGTGGNGTIEDSTPDMDYYPGGPATFTVTSSEVGRTWDKLPWRERYQWYTPKSPCHAFKLQVPDERQSFSTLELCIFRPHLEYPDDADQFMKHEEEESNLIVETKEATVYGYVKGRPGSNVYGELAGISFYGEVSVYDEESKSDVVYVVEEIKLLKKLMRENEKILRNILFVMGKVGNSSIPKYNAVVTQGASLMNFMVNVNPSEFVRGSFLVFSTARTSYITAGEPMMEVDDDGKITFNAGGDKIVIDPESHSSIHLMTGNDRKYTFRPNGKTILQDGNNVTVLKEKEGAVAVSAFTAESSYGCVLPTPAFRKRGGGYVCKVCFAADKSFLDKYMYIQPPMKTVRFLTRMIDNVSWIFRSTDWNEDGHSDNVGLTYDRQWDLWEHVDNGNETVTYEELEVLYGKLARMDFTDCCVAVAYTMKRFPGSMLAKATAGLDKHLGAQKGVCGGQDAAGMANNVVLISANAKKSPFTPMTEEQLTFLTAQQIARAFGASHDGTGDDACDIIQDKRKDKDKDKAEPEPERHYLMWPDVLRPNLTLEEKTFSKCSKTEIMKVLQTCKSSCFDIDKHPFCGNGIIEDGEECDCGSEFECSKQKCCFSRLGLYPCRKTGLGCKKKNSGPKTLPSFILSFLTPFLLIKAII